MIKSIVGYISCVMFALLYTFFWDGTAGITFFSVLIIAPILSVSMTLAAKSKINISVESSSKMLKKGETTEVTVTFRNHGRITAPFLEVSLYPAPNFNTKASKFMLSLRAGKQNVIKQSYTAKIWGEDVIGIKDVVIWDYLGLMKFPLYIDNGQYNYAETIGICPEIPDIYMENVSLSCTTNTVSYEGNEEMVENSTLLGGFPGYEHRAYIPGDKLNRINWKLSSKRGEYLVRLEESEAGCKQILVLDTGSQGKDSENSSQLERMLLEEKTVETVLAMLMGMVRQSSSCSFYYYMGNDWVKADIDNIGDVLNLQYSMIKYKFSQHLDKSSFIRIPVERLLSQKKDCSFTLVTCNLDEELSREIQNANQKGMVIHTVTAE